jgi:hypothetical protein
MDRSAVDRFARGIGLLSYATEGLTPEELRSHPGPGDWSTAQVVIHLVDSDLVLCDRMKRVISEDEPALLAFDENRWARGLCYEDQSVGNASTLFDLNRRQMLEVLRRLNDASFDRAGIHSERGRLTLAQLVSGAANHLDHHLKFIYQKRERLGRVVPNRYSQT